MKSAIQIAALFVLSSLALADGIPGQGTWETTLKPRDLNNDGVADAYYDTQLDITWLANADYLYTGEKQAYLSALRPPEAQLEVINFLRGTHHLGVSSWRLPDQSNPNLGSTSGELEHLYTQTLGNTSVAHGGSLTNTGPFHNVGRNCYVYEGPVVRNYDNALGPSYSFNSYQFEGEKCEFEFYSPYLDPQSNPKVWPVADGDVISQMQSAPVYTLERIATHVRAGNERPKVEANDINDLGQVVGCTLFGGEQKAFLFDDAGLHSLGTLNSDNSGESCAFSINNAGDIAGTSMGEGSRQSQRGSWFGFLYNNNIMHELEFPTGTAGKEGSRIGSGHHINDAGDITVLYTGWLDPTSAIRHFPGAGLLTAEGAAETIDGDELTSPIPTGLAQNGNWLAYTWFGPGDVTSDWATDLVIDGEPRAFTSGSWSNFDINEIEVGYQWYGLHSIYGAFGNFHRIECNPECQPRVSYGLTRTSEGTESRIYATERIIGLNDAGDMTGHYLGRAFVKPANGPTLFIDDLVDLGGYELPEVTAINNRGDILLRLYDRPENSFSIFVLRRADTQPALLSIDNRPSAKEGNYLKFKVKLSKPTPDNVTFNVQTIDGTANSPDDYLPKGGPRMLAAGQTERTIWVQTVDDETIELNEKLRLRLSNPTNAKLTDGKSEALGIIVDNDDLDNKARLTIGNAAGVEGGYARFKVKLSSPTQNDVRINITTINGSATEDQDFESKRGIRIIPAGSTQKTIFVKLHEDGLNEGTEKFTLRVAAQSNNVVNADEGLATGTIYER